MADKVLDRYEELSVLDTIMQALDEAGYNAEEAIPGLVLAIYSCAELLPERVRDQALDEAATMLADGPES